MARKRKATRKQAAKIGGLRRKGMSTRLANKIAGRRKRK